MLTPADRVEIAFVSLLGLRQPHPCDAVAALLPATCAVPTFSYSYPRGDAYDMATSPCRAGAMGTWCLSQGWVRTVDPIFSLATRGVWPPALFTIGDVACFGARSPWAYLLDADGWIGCYGCDMDSVTFIHHVEWCAEVDYRHDVTFRGLTCGRPTQATYFARVPTARKVTSLARLADRCAPDEEWAPFPGWRVHRWRARRLAESATVLLKEDPYGLVAAVS